MNISDAISELDGPPRVVAHLSNRTTMYVYLDWTESMSIPWPQYLANMNRDVSTMLWDRIMRKGVLVSESRVTVCQLRSGIYGKGVAEYTMEWEAV